MNNPLQSFIPAVPGFVPQTYGQGYSDYHQYAFPKNKPGVAPEEQAKAVPPPDSTPTNQGQEQGISQTMQSPIANELNNAVGSSEELIPQMAAFFGEF